MNDGQEDETIALSSIPDCEGIVPFNSLLNK
jgi:hypothetical protein